MLKCVARPVKASSPGIPTEGGCERSSGFYLFVIAYEYVGVRLTCQERCQLFVQKCIQILPGACSWDLLKMRMRNGGLKKRRAIALPIFFQFLNLLQDSRAEGRV